MKRLRLAALGLLLGSCDGEGLPEIPLKLSKNCNELEVQVLAPRVGTGAEEVVLDVAADSTLSDTAWVLVRRPSADGEGELAVQQVGAQGIEREVVLPTSAIISPSLSLEAAPESGRVWVVRDEPGVFEVWRIAPDDPIQPVLGSENLTEFPSDGPLCAPCDTELWHRDLVFLNGSPALASLPPFSVDAGLTVWVALLDAEGFQIQLRGEHRLNFEPPCEAEEGGEDFCEQQRETLRYPEVTVLGKQADPRQLQSVFFGHRTREQSFDGDPFPLEGADVFMVSLFFGEDGIPAGVLRSYSGLYTPSGGPLDASAPPLPSASPPFGVAVDRFAAYGLFTNGGVLPRLVQLPNVDPDFTEMTDRVTLSTETQLLQLDRDLAMGELSDGRWRLTKLFPDDPSQSGVSEYATDASIEEVVTGGVGVFMLRKQGAPPEVLRLRCPVAGGDSE